ncbi:MAG: TMEM175 family protein [Pseudomonadota bacterium]|jgi:uncharacterized membrane protein
MYPKARLDTLSDGIFAVAMTLLVLDLRLPDDIHPADSQALLQALLQLWPKLLPYLLSFGVLGLRWLSNVQIRTREDYFDRGYVRWWLLYHLLITCIPFSTIVLGRYASLAPSTWLYAGHTLLIALINLRLVQLTPGLERDHHLLLRQTSLVLLAASSLLAIAISLIDPPQAMWAYLLNLATPVVHRRLQHGPQPHKS